MKRDDLFVTLLYKMSQFLGYSYTKANLERNAGYSPVAHETLLQNQEAVKNFVLDIISGKKGLPITIQDNPKESK